MTNKVTEKEISGTKFYGNETAEKKYALTTIINNEQVWIVSLGTDGEIVKVNQGMQNEASMNEFVLPLIEGFKDEIETFRAQYQMTIEQQWDEIEAQMKARCEEIATETGIDPRHKALLIDEKLTDEEVNILEFFAARHEQNA